MDIRLLSVHPIFVHLSCCEPSDETATPPANKAADETSGGGAPNACRSCARALLVVLQHLKRIHVPARRGKRER